jgi:hypothetical protein
VQAADYALALYKHASAQLDSHALHAWMVCRLMLDEGLEHTEATQLTDTVLTDAPATVSPRQRPKSRARRTGALIGV